MVLRQLGLSASLEASDLLIFLTSQVNVRLYTALASASLAYAACSRFSGLRSSSPLAMIFLWVRASLSVVPSTPRSLVRYLSWFSVVTWALLSSSAAKWMLPRCRTLATMLSKSSTSSSVKSMTDSAFLITFQSLLSLMEETLAHWPFTRYK